MDVECTGRWQSSVAIDGVPCHRGIAGIDLPKNHARARYGLWLAASVKFLIPFSLLVALGTHLARPRGPAEIQTGVLVAMQEVSQPFTTAAAGFPAAEKSRMPAQDAGRRYRLVHLLPAILLTIWL